MARETEAESASEEKRVEMRKTKTNRGIKESIGSERVIGK